MLSRCVALIFGLLIGGFAVVAFAGERYVYGGASEGSSDNALSRCTAHSSGFPSAWISSPCAYQGSQCPGSQDGGTCEEVATFGYHNYGNTSQPVTWSGQNFKYVYCPDATPMWSGTKCVKPEEVCDGKVIGTSSISAVLTGSPKGNEVCLNNCVYTGSKVVCAPTLSGGTTSGGDAVSLAKVCEITGPFTPMKKSCDASPSGEPNIASPYALPPKPWYDNGKGITDCASSGGAWGQIDGIDTCVRGGAGSSGGTGSSGTGSGKAVSGTDTGSTSKTETTTDGSTKTTDTKTSTTCEGDNCSTTTTTTTTVIKSDGSKETTTDSKTDVKSSNSFCVDNPASSLCVKNSFSGDCNSDFACSGDPVLCATAKAAAASRCDVVKTASLFPEITSESLAADSLKGDKALNKDGSSDMNLATIFEDKRQNYIDITSECPAGEMGFEVNGRSFNFDLSIMCTIGAFVRLLLRISAYLMVLALFRSALA